MFSIGCPWLHGVPEYSTALGSLVRDCPSDARLTAVLRGAEQTTSSGMRRWSGKLCAWTGAAQASGRFWASPLAASVR